MDKKTLDQLFVFWLIAVTAGAGWLCIDKAAELRTKNLAGQVERIMKAQNEQIAVRINMLAAQLKQNQDQKKK